MVYRMGIDVTVLEHLQRLLAVANVQDLYRIPFTVYESILVKLQHAVARLVQPVLKSWRLCFSVVPEPQFFYFASRNKQLLPHLPKSIDFFLLGKYLIVL